MQLQISQHASFSLPVKKKEERKNNVFEPQTPLPQVFFKLLLHYNWIIKCRNWDTKWNAETSVQKTNLNFRRSGWTCACQGAKSLLSLLQLFILFNLEKNGKKTTTKQLNKMPWREAETNPTSKYRLHQQLYLLWNRRNAQPKAFRSLLQLIHVHLHGDKKSQVLKVLSLTGGRKPCSDKSHFSALTGDLLFATAPVGENKCQKGRVRKGR